MPANLENSAVATELEKVSFHSNPKMGSAKECSNYRTIALISVQFSSVSQLCPTLYETIANFRSIPKLTSIESVMPSNHLVLCRPLLLLPSIFLKIRVFSNESALCIRWPKDWNFSIRISPSNEYSGLISFRMDWLDLLAFQGTLKSFLQHHSSKA